VTNADGEFTFHNVQNAANYRLSIARDGILANNGELGGFGVFITAAEIDVSGAFPYGEPSAIVSANNDLFLLIDDVQTPTYTTARPAGQEYAFNGDSRPLAFWQYQLQILNGDHDGVPAYSESKLNAIVSKALGELSGCGYNQDTLQTGDALDKLLFAARLNEAAGKGVFDPYHKTALLFLDYAQHIACDGSFSSVDVAVATDLVSRVLNTI